MVHRRVKRERGEQPSGSHNRAWIWGRHVVLETLRAGRWPMLEIAVSDQLAPPQRAELEKRAESLGTPLIETDDAGVTKLCRAADHQGCAARMGAFPYLSGREFLAALSGNSVILILDRIQDPYNFGAMIRTADGLGIDGIVIGSTEQTGVNSLAARSSAGAVNHVPIGRVDDLAAFVSELPALGFHVWGATERGSQSIDRVSFQPPLALIIGNEGDGISPELLAGCTGTVKIPMQGRVGSLNAAVSAGILCYETIRVCRRISSGS